MELKIFAVRDAALGQFMNPFVAPSAGMAIRSFSDEVNRKDSPLFLHPSDYELFELGTYDPDTGIITSNPALSLARAKDLIVNGTIN